MARTSARGDARRKRLLESARYLLRSTRLSELTLSAVAKHARVPKGSAYFFYEDITALYASLLTVIEEELHALLLKPLRRVANEWQDVIGELIDRGSTWYAQDAAARQLIIGVDTPPALKMHDRASDIELGKIFEDHVASAFKLPAIAERSALFFRAVEIADLMFCLSMLEHGRVTPEYGAEAKRAAVAYLESYLPKKLRRVKRGRSKR
jgi:AcrR family transcriptional regulator